jgi:hypothetical protein
MTPRQLYKWDGVKIPPVTFGHFTAEDHSKGTMLQDFQESSNTSGTQKKKTPYHFCLKKPPRDVVS